MSVGTGGVGNGAGQWCQDGITRVYEARSAVGLGNGAGVGVVGSNERKEGVTITPFKAAQYVTKADFDKCFNNMFDTSPILNEANMKAVRDAMAKAFELPPNMGWMAGFGFDLQSSLRRFPMSIPYYKDETEPATWVGQSMPCANVAASQPIYGATFYHATVNGVKAYRCVSVLATTRDNRMGAVLQDVETGNTTMTVACDDLDLPAHRRNEPAEWHWTEARAAGHVDSMQRQAKARKIATAATKMPTVMDLFRKAITDAIGNYKGRYKVEYTRALCSMTERRGCSIPQTVCVAQVDRVIEKFEAAIARGYRCGLAFNMTDVLDYNNMVDEALKFYVKARGFTLREGIK